MLEGCVTEPNDSSGGSPGRMLDADSVEYAVSAGCIVSNRHWHVLSGGFDRHVGYALHPLDFGSYLVWRGVGGELGIVGAFATNKGSIVCALLIVDGALSCMSEQTEVYEFAGVMHMLHVCGLHRVSVFNASMMSDARFISGL